MTKDEALDKALEALEKSVATCFDRCAHEQVMSRPEHFINQAITAIKQARSAPVQEPDELKHIGEQDSLLDVDESAWYLLVENRGGCRCHISPPCSACSNPISEEEMNEVGYTYTTPPAAQPAPVQEFSYKGPEELWLQLHGDCSDDELTDPVDYTDDSVTWCWHQIHNSDARYVRADIATPPAQPAPVQPVKPSLWEQYHAAQPAHVPERTDYAVHLNHCNIGECEGVCKYLDDDCPALKHADMKAKWDRTTPPAAQPAPVQQEPVIAQEGDTLEIETILYTSPQRTWVGLTDEDKRQIFEREDYQGWLDYINAIEAKLKEKNT
jgi:hypothetical protein